MATSSSRSCGAACMVLSMSCFFPSCSYLVDCFVLASPLVLLLKDCLLCSFPLPPSDQDFAIKWWESCFMARRINQIGHAEMIAVAQALEMAVDQCERISGTVVTKARIKMPGKAEEIKSQADAIPWPMPKLVSVFTDSQQVLSSIDTCWRSGRWPGNRSPMKRANEMIEALGDLGVRVHLQWVPGHSGDLRNRWAHEGARNALKPQHHTRKTCTKRVHRVSRRCHKDRPRKKKTRKRHS